MSMNPKKTIFIPIASNTACRNIFYHPDGVFSILKRSRPDIFFVILVLKKEHDKYTKLLGEGLGTRFTIEPVYVPSASTFAQKLFHFFYSYLLYTKSTVVLATMGTRPGEPPAGGRKYLAPLKWLIARTIGRSEYVRLRIVPRLFQKIFTDRPFKNLFDRYQPSLVFSTHIYGWFDTMLLAEAKRRGITTVGMPAGWDHLDKYYLPFHTDRLLAQSNEIIKAAVTYQSYRKEQIRLTGYPYFDYFVRRSYQMPRVKLLDELHLPPDAHYILYVSGTDYCPDEPDVIEAMAQWIEKKELPVTTYLVIRPYPGGAQRGKAYDRQRFAKLEQHPRIRFCWQKTWADLQETDFFLNVMLYADVVMQVYTTVALEVTALDRPILSTLFDGYRILPFRESIRRFEKFEHFQDVIRTGALAQAHGFDELKTFLNRFLADPDYLRKERNLMKKELCGPLDGKSSERIAKALIDMMTTSPGDKAFSTHTHRVVNPPH